MLLSRSRKLLLLGLLSALAWTSVFEKCQVNGQNYHWEFVELTWKSCKNQWLMFQLMGMYLSDNWDKICSGVGFNFPRPYADKVMAFSVSDFCFRSGQKGGGEFGMFSIPYDGCPNAYWEMNSHNCDSDGFRKYDARLMDLPNGYSWEISCEEKEIGIGGVNYHIPSRCQNTGDAKWGIWYIPDTTCCTTGSNFCDGSRDAQLIKHPFPNPAHLQPNMDFVITAISDVEGVQTLDISKAANSFLITRISESNERSVEVYVMIPTIVHRPLILQNYIKIKLRDLSVQVYLITQLTYGNQLFFAFNKFTGVWFGQIAPSLDQSQAYTFEALRRAHYTSNDDEYQTSGSIGPKPGETGYVLAWKSIVHGKYALTVFYLGRDITLTKVSQEITHFFPQ